MVSYKNLSLLFDVRLPLSYSCYYYYYYFNWDNLQYVLIFICCPCSCVSMMNPLWKRAACQDRDYGHIARMKYATWVMFR